MKLMKGLVLLLGVSGAAAQHVGSTPRMDAKEIPSYELVSIHQGTPDRPANGGINDDPDGITATGVTLRTLIGEAYGFSLGQLSEQELVGGPAWAKTQLFDVRAKVDPDDVVKLKAIDKADNMMALVRDFATRTPSARMVMLQRLLEDRFNVKVHYEQRTMTLYEMTLAKGGVKMKAAQPKDPEHGMMQMDHGKLKGENVPMSFIPAILTLEVEKPVVDRTDTGGNYDFEMHWSRMGDEADSGVDASAPSLFTAVQEQMGLKLKAGKGPVWVIVVDHAELPAEN